MRRLIDRLTEYANQHLPELSGNYTWDFNEAVLESTLGITAAGDCWYEKNLDLKRQISEQWLRADTVTRTRLAHYYVAIWGGIRGNQAGRLEGYVRSLSQGELLPFNGIASWSKIAVIASPQDNAILDARVAFSLNALQFLNPECISAWFPRMESRNSLIRRVRPCMDWQAAAQRRDTDLPRHMAYATYISLLQSVSDELADRPGLAPLEMLLFAKAEELAADVDRALT